MSSGKGRGGGGALNMEWIQTYVGHWYSYFFFLQVYGSRHDNVIFYHNEPRTSSITKFSYGTEEDYKSFIIYG